jgi:hypothetical protein
MSAKDYRICPALFNAYIAKTSKKDKNLMTDDRREISEEEILSLIDWWLYKNCADDGKVMMFESLLRENSNVVLKYEPKKGGRNENT